MISAFILAAAALGQDPAVVVVPPVAVVPPAAVVVPAPAVSVLIAPPRVAWVQPPAVVYQPPVVVQPPAYVVPLGPRIVPRRPFLAWMGFPVHHWVMVP